MSKRISKTEKLTQERDKALSDLAYCREKIKDLDVFLEQLLAVTFPNSYNRPGRTDLLREIVHLVGMREGMKGAIMPQQMEIQNLKEIIRWHVNPETAKKQDPFMPGKGVLGGLPGAL